MKEGSFSGPCAGLSRQSALPTRPRPADASPRCSARGRGASGRAGAGAAWRGPAGGRQDHAATPGPLAGDTTGTAAAPNASGAAAGPQRHSRAQGLAPGDPSGRVGTRGRGWSPAVPLQVSVTPASPRRRGAGPVLCWGLRTWAQLHGLLGASGSAGGGGRGRARRPAAPAGEEGSGGRARGGCVRARPVSPRLALGVCVVLGTSGRPGSPGQGRAEARGHGHPGAAPGLLSLGGATQWRTLCSQALSRV